MNGKKIVVKALIRMWQCVMKNSVREKKMH